MPESRRRWEPHVVIGFITLAAALAITRRSGLAEGLPVLAVGALISVLFEILRRARRRLEHRLHRAELMVQAGLRLSRSLDATAIYSDLRELISRAMRCDGMIISSYDPVTSTVRCAYGWVNGRSLNPGTLPPLSIHLETGTGMQTEVIRSGEGRLYADVRARVKRPGRYYDVGPRGEVRDLSKPGAEPPGSRCAVMVPVKLEEKVVGIVQVMSDVAGAFSREHLYILESLVAPMAVALQNAELYTRAHHEIEERRRVEGALKESEERLLEASQHKDEFLATLAHELRNPLAPIRNAVAILRSSGSAGRGEAGAHHGGTNGAAAQDRQAWCQEVIERQVTHMSRLLDDLLDLGRISRGTLRLVRERVELAEIVRHAVEASFPLIDAGGHELTTTLPAKPIYLEADATRLAQVFSNLLNNAARYSEDGKKIHLVVEREGTEAVIRVKDQGIGISEAMLPRIFEPFLQIDQSLERSQGGLGIGLTLVKQIVEVHDGRVEAKSEGLGKGSEFIVRLPVAAPAPNHLPPVQATAAKVPDLAEAAPSSTAPSEPPGNRVLVVDDVKDSADGLATLLASCGHDVRTAYDGEEAVKAAREFRPDVVLLDIGMPRLNGYEAARRIREERWDQPPVLIALTGWGQDDNRRRTREAGFDCHLVKPIDPDALVRMITSRTY